MDEYNSSFQNRFSKFLYAQKTYPFVMTDEYSTALEMCDLKENDVFINIPADFNSLEPLLPSNIKYFPFEINKDSSSITKYTFCPSLSNLPFKNQSVDVILCLASLHHFDDSERVKFYNECLRLSNKLVIGDVILNSDQDRWLNIFVNQYNSSGHVGHFFSEKDKILLEQCGFNVEVKKVKYKWHFRDENTIVDFCKNLFGLDLATSDDIKNGIQKYLALNSDFSFDWELIYFKCDNPFRLKNKPSDWNSLELYKKLQFYKMNLNISYSKYVDKLAVKDILRNVKNLHFAKVVKELNSANDITINDIDQNCILKSTHASGWNINFKKDKNLYLIKEKLKKWSTVFKGCNEPHYKFIRPRFFIEEKINDKYLGLTDEALVYMFRCVHGEVITISVKYKNLNLDNQYDSNFNLIKKELDFNIEKPSNFLEMIDIVKELSKIFEFVRVDLFLSSDDKIYFSELTFTPHGAKQFFSNEKEMECGKYWK
jgi:hypothetical protein